MVITLLLPLKPEKPRGGRSRIPDSAVLKDILFVLSTGYLGSSYLRKWVAVRV
jgi:hypothetical protein